MQENDFTLERIQSSFFKSTMWIAVIISCAIVFMIIAQVINVDFLHSNPGRSQANALLIMFLFPPIFFIIATIGTALVFGASQYVQTLLATSLLKKYGGSGLFGIVLILPFLAVLTWYCFDYLTPTDFNLGINEGPEWVPYQHGLTSHRYLTTLIVQSCVTVFSILRLWLEIGGRNSVNKNVLMVALIAAACVGSFLGYPH